MPEPTAPEELKQETPPEPTPERPDWLDERFESVEAQARSYSEAEKRMRQATQEAAEYRKRADQADLLEQQIESLTQQQTPQGFDPMQHPLIAGAQQALDNGDVVGLLAAVQQLMPQPAAAEPAARPVDEWQVEQLHQSVQQRYSADDDMRSAAYELMSSNPLLAGALEQWAERPNATLKELEPVIDAAYQLAGATAKQAEQATLAQQQAEKEQARQRKLEQESLSGAGPTRMATPSEQEEAWDKIKNANLGSIRLGGVD